MGTQKNRLNETALLSTQNISLNLWVRLYLHFYAQKCCFLNLCNSKFCHLLMIWMAVWHYDVIPERIVWKRKMFKKYQPTTKVHEKWLTMTLKKLRTSKGSTSGSSSDALQLRAFSTIASLFKMRTSLKGKNLLPKGANSFLYEQFLMVWKITFTTYTKWPPLSVTIFIAHMHILRNGSYAND